MSINAIRLSAYGFRMEAVGGKKFIKRERDAFLEFAAGRVNETAQNTYQKRRNSESCFCWRYNLDYV